MHKIIDSANKMKDSVTNLIYVLQELEKILSVKIIEMNELSNKEVSLLDDISKYYFITNILEEIKDKNGKLLKREFVRAIDDGLRIS